MRNRALAVVGLTVLIIGSTVLLLSVLHGAAQGQQAEKPARWEYKVVPSHIEWEQEEIRGPDGQKSRTSSPEGVDKTAARLTGEYNKLSGDGWEYVGPIFKGRMSGSEFGAFVLFRRPAPR
jgi:hypothetical protein